MSMPPSTFQAPHHYPWDTDKDHALIEWQGLWCCSCRVQIYMGSKTKYDAASRHAQHVDAVREIRSRALQVGGNGYGYSDDGTVEEPSQSSPFRRGVGQGQTNRPQY